ncbi:MAG: ATP-binding protein [Clostridia bacterium]|nr:ATP-binding protein [Clostridia bacterium]
MAGIGKNSSAAADKKDSVEELKKQFEISHEKIAKIKNNRKDKNDISKEEQSDLRREYLRMAQIAKTLSTRLTDEAEAKKFADFVPQLTERAQQFGSSVSSAVPKTTFDDVKGLENVKKLVKSFMFMAQNPELLKHYKLEGGLGMLMYGAPGTGKTMFAEAIANAMHLPLFIVTPADIFKSYVGESEQAVKQLFQELDACPDGAILFVDECESIFSKRTQDTKDYKAAVTTELLQRINGFGVNGAKRIMIGATNRPDVIDPAYLRYKRFSHLVHVTPPDRDAKRSIIEGKLKGIGLSDVTVEDILEMTERRTVAFDPNVGAYADSVGYYSAADLCGIMEEACRLALEEMQEKGITNVNDALPLTREMFEKAFKKTPPSISQELLDSYDHFRDQLDN